VWVKVKTTYNIRIDSDIKAQADNLFNAMGLTLSSAVNLFLKQAIIQDKFPIENIVSSILPGKKTADA